MKYLKHFYVDSKNNSQFLIWNNDAPNGKTHPPLSGLDVKIWVTEPQTSIDYCLSVCPDITPVPVIAGIEQLTFEQWALKAETNFNAIKGDSQLVIDKTSLESIMNSYTELSAEQKAERESQIAGL